MSVKKMFSKQLDLSYGFHMESRLSPALEESPFRGRQLVCTRGRVSYGLTPIQALLPFLVENKQGLALNCWQRMNNIEMHGMPRMNMCLAFVEILACEKQACLNILAFLCPS